MEMERRGNQYNTLSLEVFLFAHHSEYESINNSRPVLPRWSTVSSTVDVVRVAKESDAGEWKSLMMDPF